MSTTYQPGQIPDDPSGLVDALRREFAAIKRGAEDGAPSIGLVVLHGQPARIRPGMLVYADGTDWNPGAGEGVYRRNKANSAWVHLG